MTNLQTPASQFSATSASQTPASLGVCGSAVAARTANLGHASETPTLSPQWALGTRRRRYTPTHGTRARGGTPETRAAALTIRGNTRVEHAWWCGWGVGGVAPTPCAFRRPQSIMPTPHARVARGSTLRMCASHVTRGFDPRRRRFPHFLSLGRWHLLGAIVFYCFAHFTTISNC